MSFYLLKNITLIFTKFTYLMAISSMCVNYSVVSDSLQPHGLQPARLLGPWNSPGKSTGVGCHALLQGIFPTQRWNPGLSHCRRLYRLSHQGSPRILGWVVYPFCRGINIIEVLDTHGPFTVMKQLVQTQFW